MHQKSFFKNIWQRLFKVTEQTDPLADAIENAVILLMIASEKAYVLEDETISAVIKMRCQYLAGSSDTDCEVKFWSAYTQIALVLYPITIDSVKANSPHRTMGLRNSIPLFNVGAQSLSQKCARKYKTLSAIVLLFLIFTQVYWYIGFALITDFNTQSGNIDTLGSTIQELEIKLTNQPDSDQHAYNLQELTSLKLQLEEHRNWKEAAVTHLQNWNDVWSSLDYFTDQPWQVANFQTLGTKIQQRIQLVSAENALQAISTYLLPMLYGLIGACFYILRKLPKEIEDLTFSNKSYTNYSLRIAQGPLAGILVSYFVTPTPQATRSSTDNIESLLNIDPGVSSLSPLALAFVAGYSVEFIFKILDKILSLPLAESESVSKNTPRLNCPLISKPLNQKDNSS
jgi:hypothetical protein